MALPTNAQDGDKEPCPKCTEKVGFHLRTPIPITGAEWVPDDDGRWIQPTAAELEPAWKCEACGYYEAVPFNW